MNLFYQPLIEKGSHHLDEEESRHCLKVLRKRAGDPVTITDGRGSFYEGIIRKADDRRCEFTVIAKHEVPQKHFSIHIAISPTKNADRIEWFVEKAVEIGVDHISLLHCENSERTFLKTDRLRRVAVSAMKQSLKAWLPEILPLSPFREFIAAIQADEKYIAFVDASNPAELKDLAGAGRSYLILIGPEGDFSPEELAAASAQGFAKVSLGKSRMRTETAGLVACHTLNLINS